MRLLIAAALAVAATAVQAEADSGLLYQLESEVTLPSTNSGWDYIKMEPSSSRLFLARDRDGLTVFDVDQSKAIMTVKNSVGANGPLLLPQYNRGYVAMTDGSLLSFDLKTLAPIERLALDERNGKLYVVAAAYTIGKPDAQGNVPDEVYHPNTFVVLTYKPV